MSDKNHQTEVLHSERAFLAPETERWNCAACVTYVHVHTWDGQSPGDLDIESEVTITDPSGDSVRFDGSYSQSAAAHLATIDALIAQLTHYRAAYAGAQARLAVPPDDPASSA